MNIAERLERQDNEDIVLIGNLMDSEAATVTRLMIQNLLNLELSHSRQDTASAERKLGRLEAYRTVLDDMQGFHDRARELQQPIAPPLPDVEGATEQITRPKHAVEI